MLFPCPACNSARLFGSLSVTVVTCGLTRDKLVKISIRQENQLDDWAVPRLPAYLDTEAFDHAPRDIPLLYGSGTPKLHILFHTAPPARTKSRLLC
jgi:hypothetical protein